MKHALVSVESALHAHGNGRFSVVRVHKGQLLANGVVARFANYQCVRRAVQSQPKTHLVRCIERWVHNQHPNICRPLL